MQNDKTIIVETRRLSSLRDLHRFHYGFLKEYEHQNGHKESCATNHCKWLSPATWSQNSRLSGQSQSKQIHLLKRTERNTLEIYHRASRNQELSSWVPLLLSFTPCGGGLSHLHLTSIQFTFTSNSHSAKQLCITVLPFEMARYRQTCGMVNIYIRIYTVQSMYINIIDS